MRKEKLPLKNTKSVKGFWKTSFKRKKEGIALKKERLYEIPIDEKKVAAVLNNPQQQEAVLGSIAANPALLQKVNEKAVSKAANNMNGMNMGSCTVFVDSGLQPFTSI